MLPLKQQRGPDLLHLDRRTRTFSSTARGIVFFRRRRLAPPSYARCPPLHGQARTQEQPKREDLLPAPVALLPGGEKEEKEKEVKTEEKEGGRRFSSFVVDVDERRCRILVRLKGSPSHPLLFSSLLSLSSSVHTLIHKTRCSSGPQPYSHPAAWPRGPRTCATWRARR